MTAPDRASVETSLLKRARKLTRDHHPEDRPDLFLQLIDDLCSALRSQQEQSAYDKGNPLGGPATMFDTIATRLRAGEEYWSVMADYGIRFDRQEQCAAATVKDSLTVQSAPAAVWRPISEAPRDGTRVNLWIVHPTRAVALRCGEDGEQWHGAVVGSWIDHNGGGWSWHGMSGTPTLWSPLPPPPTETEKGNG